MQRLGELLIDAGLLGSEQVAQALRAQVLWGGKLGTNLVELGYVDLDDIAHVLGRQHRYPAALAWHFAQADAVLQRRLAAQTAERYACVPLARAGDKVIVATAAPIDACGLGVIASELGTTSSLLVPALAAELRIRYFLERIYDVPRETRYLRTRSACRLPFVTECPRPSKRLSATSDDRTLPLAPVAIAAEPRSERRRYVTTLGMPQLADLAPPKRFARGTDAMGARRTLPELTSFATATRAIRGAIDREQIGDLVVATLAGFVPSCVSATLLVVHGGVAIPVTGFRRDGKLVPDLAVPLDRAGMVPAAIRERAAGRAPAVELEVVDRELLDALGATGGDLLVEPIAVVGHVLGALVVAARPGDPVAATPDVAHATSSAFSRLIRDAAK